MDERETIIVDNFNNVQEYGLKLPLISVTYGTTDFNQKYVGRLFESAVPYPTKYAVISDTLEGVRAKIPWYMLRLERRECDDPVIVEVYI